MGYAGFRGSNHLVVNKAVSDKYGEAVPWFLYYISELMYWVSLLNLAIGTINLLPMKPLDGGLMFEELLGYKLSKEKVKPIVNTLSYILITILVVNIVYAVGRGILLSI